MSDASWEASVESFMSRYEELLELDLLTPENVAAAANFDRETLIALQRRIISELEPLTNEISELEHLDNELEQVEDGRESSHIEQLRMKANRVDDKRHDMQKELETSLHQERGGFLGSKGDVQLGGGYEDGEWSYFVTRLHTTYSDPDYDFVQEYVFDDALTAKYRTRLRKLEQAARLSEQAGQRLREALQVQRERAEAKAADRAGKIAELRQRSLTLSHQLEVLMEARRIAMRKALGTL